MCTVSWNHTPSGFEVLFNRDEMKSRKSSRPPVLGTYAGIRYLAARDGEFGGTWFLANEHGLAAGILNDHSPVRHEEPERFISRGLLMADLAASGTPAEVGELLHERDLSMFRPFLLFSISLHCEGAYWLWDGARLRQQRLTRADLPLCTSTFKPVEVIESRKRIFKKILGSNGVALYHERLLQAHRAYIPGKPAHSVLMESEAEQTESLSYVRVTAEGIRYEYRPRMAGQPKFGAPIVSKLPLIHRRA